MDLPVPANNASLHIDPSRSVKFPTGGPQSKLFTLPAAYTLDLAWLTGASKRGEQQSVRLRVEYVIAHKLGDIKGPCRYSPGLLHLFCVGLLGIF